MGVRYEVQPALAIALEALLDVVDELCLDVLYAVHAQGALLEKYKNILVINQVLICYSIGIHRCLIDPQNQAEALMNCAHEFYME